MKVPDLVNVMGDLNVYLKSKIVILKSDGDAFNTRSGDYVKLKIFDEYKDAVEDVIRLLNTIPFVNWSDCDASKYKIVKKEDQNGDTN